MERDICVGMSRQSLIMRNFDTAQGHRVAVTKSVNVKTTANAHIAQAPRKDGLRSIKIIRCCHFEIILRPKHERHVETGEFSDRRIIG